MTATATTTMVVAWKQTTCYLADGPAPGWWWFCHERRQCTPGASCGSRVPCTEGPREFAHGGGFATPEAANAAALEHRRRWHLTRPGPWIHVGDGYWTPIGQVLE
jgi:hypothetical protein